MSAYDTHPVIVDGLPLPGDIIQRNKFHRFEVIGYRENSHRSLTIQYRSVCRTGLGGESETRFLIVGIEHYAATQSVEHVECPVCSQARVTYTARPTCTVQPARLVQLSLLQGVE